MNMKSIYCPACAAQAPALFEPQQYVCLDCRKVWRVVDVIQDAYDAMQKAINAVPPAADLRDRAENVGSLLAQVAKARDARQAGDEKGGAE